MPTVFKTCKKSRGPSQHLGSDRNVVVCVCMLIHLASR
eukprot:SAG11_NODE_30837_length_297_cov_0.727273_1_plen_37_part_01